MNYGQKTQKEEPIKKKYVRMARNYDDRWNRYGRRTIRRTLELIDLDGPIRMLDIGFGTGILLEEVLETHPNVEVVGGDISMDMLEVARRKFGPDLQLAGATARSLPFADSSFDVAVTCSSFHYWRQPENALAEVGRVLKPGGRLLLTDWCTDYFMFSLLDITYRIFRKSHYKLLNMHQCRSLLVKAGFRNVSIERYRVGFIWGMMTAQAENPVRAANPEPALAVSRCSTGS